MALDMTTIARFLVLPGAEELVEAFARIPPGALRDSVVSHAQVIANTYSAAPAAQQMPDPLLMASNAQGGIARAISGPRVGEIKVDDPATKAVQLRLQGRTPEECAEETGLSLLQVNAAFKRAKNAGVALPPLPKGQPLSDEPTKRYVMFMTELEDDARTAGIMRRAAERWGLTLKQYVNRRRRLVELRKKNAPMDKLVRELHPIPEKTLWNWITMARRAHIDIPASLEGEGRITMADLETVEPPLVAAHIDIPASLDDAAEIHVAPEPEAEPAPVAELPEPDVWPVPYGLQDWFGQKITRATAKNAGLTIEQQQAREADIIARFKAGEYPVQIAETLDVPGHLISSIRRRALEGGVRLPKLIKGGGASKAMGRPFGLAAFMAEKAAAKAAREAEEVAAGKPPRERAEFPTFPLFVDELQGAGRTRAEQAAAKLNATLEGYMALRRSAVAMFIRGIKPPEVAAQLGLDKKMMDNWNFQSRAAGRQVVEPSHDAPSEPPLAQDQAPEAAPRAAAAPEPPAPPPTPPTTPAARTPSPEPAPQRSPAAAEVSGRREAPRGFWTEVGEVPARGRGMAEEAARDMKLSLEEYAAVRRRALELYRKGFLPAHVAKELKLSNKQASNWRDRMKSAGLLQFGGATVANDTADAAEQKEQIA